MKISLVIYAERDDPWPSLHSAYDERDVAADHSVVVRQVTAMLAQPTVNQATAIVVDIDDAVIRAHLAPDAATATPPEVPSKVVNVHT